MALLLAEVAPAQLVECRTFAELGDRPDFVQAARRSRSFSDSFILNHLAYFNKADCDDKLTDLSDAETAAESLCSFSLGQAASDSDAESQDFLVSASAVPPGYFHSHSQSSMTSWAPVTVAAACPQLPSSHRILARPVKQTPDVENDMHKTTVMLRNMPNNYNRALLLELLDRESFARQYDFVYLPFDFDSRVCKGFAFINLRDPATALRFFRTFEGYTKWAVPSRKASGVSWSGTQGLQTHIDRYRNSSIMKDSTPDEYKPAIFVNGVRVPFPSSSRRGRRS